MTMEHVREIDHRGPQNHGEDFPVPGYFGEKSVRWKFDDRAVCFGHKARERSRGADIDEPVHTIIAAEHGDESEKHIPVEVEEGILRARLIDAGQGADAPEQPVGFLSA